MNDVILLACDERGWGRALELLAAKYPAPAPAGTASNLAWGEVTMLDGPFPGYSSVTGEGGEIFCAVGRPVLPGAHRDGFVNRGLSDRLGTDDHRTKTLHAFWLQFGDESLAKALTGEYAIFIIYPHQQRVTVITDVMNSVPVCYGRNDNMCTMCIGTQADVVAELLGTADAYDTSAMVDFVIHLRTCFPYTFYRDVENLPPGSVCRLDLKPVVDSDVQITPYWTPLSSDGSARRLKELAEQLRDTFQAAVRDAIQDAEHVGVLLSGGMDSRVILAALPKGIRVTAFTVADRSNAATEIACRVAEQAGVRWHLFLRHAEYYASNAEAAVRLCGNDASLLNSHFIGLREKIAAERVDVLLGGYLANTLFRGAFSSEPATVVGMSLPFARYCGYSGPVALDPGRQSTRYAQIKAAFAKTLVDAALERNFQRSEGLKAFRKDGSHQEWLEVWPCGTDFLEISLHRRLLPKCEVFFDRRLVALAASIPTACKLNDKLYRAAFLPQLGALASIPLEGDQFPLRSPMALHYGSDFWRKGWRKLRTWTARDARTAEGISTQGSWINREWYWKHSRRLREWRESVIADPPEFIHEILDVGLASFFESQVPVYQKYHILHICIWEQVRRAGAPT